MGKPIAYVSALGLLCIPRFASYAEPVSPYASQLTAPPSWIGITNVTRQSWFERPGLGWLYFPDGTSIDSTQSWFYSPPLGWLYSSRPYFPYLFRSDTQSWLWFYDEGARSLWFYDYAMRSHWRQGEEPPSLLVRAHSALWQADTLYRRLIAEINHTDRYPIQTRGSSWELVTASNWTAGFWPGILWQMHDFTGDAYWANQGKKWLTALENQKYNTSTHDLGFMLFNSYGQAYRLTQRTDYAQILITAADSLLTRYSPAVGAIRSWSWGRWDDGSNFTVIVDNMMNLELLTWSARQTDRSDLHEAAINHALTTARDFFRPDGSTRHVVIYHESSGRVLEKTTHQGFSPESTWARGQAWALYGFTNMFRDTQDLLFLDYARKAATLFLERLPADGVPYWDFDAPGIPYEPRDTSAAAIAASALLELATIDSIQSELWLAEAEKLLHPLLNPPYWRGITNANALLDAGTYNAPEGNSDSALIWGDYYLIEALLRLIRNAHQQHGKA